MRKINLAIKRCMDVLGSLAGLVILSPLMLVAALLIRSTSGGLVFFKQERLGRNGKPFRIIKFRTMVVGAEKKGNGLFVYGANDKRITAVGKILRKTSLDEIPQLINVVKGDMSIVGPRPPVTYFPYKGYDAYPEWAKKRFQMRPGITGLAQIKTRTSVPWEKRILIDNEYIDKFNILLDIQIIVKTFVKVLLCMNIYPETGEDIGRENHKLTGIQGG